MNLLNMNMKEGSSSKRVDSILKLRDRQYEAQNRDNLFFFFPPSQITVNKHELKGYVNCKVFRLQIVNPTISNHARPPDGQRDAFVAAIHVMNM